MESFVLKWHSFKENVTGSFSKLRKEEDFVDVILVTDDNQSFKGHKVVLSAASDFFKSILRRADHSNPLIYLCGVEYGQLVHIMDYIYEGEIQIQQRDLDKFLEVAQKLKIAGLLYEYNKQQQDLLMEESVVEPIIASEEVKNTMIINPCSMVDEHSERDVEDILLNSSLLTNNKENQRPMLKIKIPSIPSKSEILDAVNKIIVKIQANHWLCSVCKQSFKSSRDLRRHAEIHIDGIALPCQGCGKIFKTSWALRCHEKRCKVGPENGLKLQYDF